MSHDAVDAVQHDMFSTGESPVLVAWGGGVDSTSMIIELHARGERMDQVLMADTGSEKPSTYAAVEIFKEWMAKRNIPFEMVKYRPVNFKNWPPYQGLAENCITNGTLPSISFGFSSCSQKFKVAPQDKWTENWEPARTIWAAGGKVTKLIGYDSSPADNKRYAQRVGHVDPKYHYRYPLREWGWKREDCEARIAAEGLPRVPKSACWMCLATKTEEVVEMPKEILRRIVLMEARAAPRLQTVEGLWRTSVKGRNGATPRPGSMTQFIREQKLLPADEIDQIINVAPKALLSWQEAMADLPLAERVPMQQWMQMFELTRGLGLDPEGSPSLYPDVTIPKLAA